MARIAHDEIEQLKRSVNLSELVRSAGVVLEAHGGDLVGLCPFHEEKTASFRITTSENLFHCFGCGVGGDVIEWVRRTRKVSFRNAVELLRELGASIPTEKHQVHAGKAAPVVSVDADDARALDEVVSYYQDVLRRTPDARQYAETRCFGTPEVIEKFRLGFADRSLGYHLPSRTLAEGKEVRERLQRIGVIKENGRELFRGCLTIPVLDENGRAVGMYGRRIGAVNADVPKHLYLPGPHRGVFNIAAFSTTKELILCEAIIDALSFYAAGHHNVSCTYGVEGFSDEIFDALKKHGIEKVYIAFDRDDAGDRGAQKVAERLIDGGVEVFRIQFPVPGMDANEFARSQAFADVGFSTLLRTASWMGKGESTATVKAPVFGDHATRLLEVSAPPIDKTPINDAIRLAATAKEPASAVEVPAPAVAPLPESLPVTTPATEKRPDSLDPKADEHAFTFGDRRYRVRGARLNATNSVLKVNVAVRSRRGFHVDTLDLLMGKTRAHFIKIAALELGVEEETIKNDVGEILDGLDAMQDKRLKAATESVPKVPPMTAEEEKAALDFLRAPNLLERTKRDFDACGVVGEETNKIVGYIAATSRKLARPLAIVIRSSSAAGKTSLMDAILSFMPDEEVEQFSAMTGQSLFYMGDKRNKILALAEEEGAERASYALKLLQSEGKLSIASTGKNPVTGMHETKEYKVEGPVMIFQTTTLDTMDEELQNRCITLTVNESREQTRAIHRAQRRTDTIDGILGELEREDIVKLHQNAQRLLKPVRIYNPFSDDLTFPDEKLRMRRDHVKYQTLIRAITLLHQYQRPRRMLTDRRGRQVECVEVALADIELANQLAEEVLGRTLDEMPPQTRNLLGAIDEMVKKRCDSEKIERTDCLFSRREIREFTGWSEIQVRRHVQSLVDLEYLLPHRGRRGQQFLYELIYDGTGKDGRPFLVGLARIEALKVKYGDGFDTSAANFDRSKGNFDMGSTAHRQPNDTASTRRVNGETPHPVAQFLDSIASTSENTDQRS